jgi:hypothetical protein
MVEPLRPPGLCDVGDVRADQAALVDALVLIEPLVLRRDERLLHVLRNLADRHPDAALVGLEQFRKLVALAVEHRAGAGQLQVLELAVIRQVGGDAVVEFDHLLEVEPGVVHRRVAAELLVGRAEVVEVDAAERLNLAGHGLRIGQRGVDQRVQVKVFDIESLAHVRAAVAEKLHDLALIGNRIEARLQRFRTRRHLRERERSGKHLDENQVHRLAARPTVSAAKTTARLPTSIAPSASMPAWPRRSMNAVSPIMTGANTIAPSPISARRSSSIRVT